MRIYKDLNREEKIVMKPLIRKKKEDKEIIEKEIIFYKHWTILRHYTYILYSFLNLRVLWYKCLRKKYLIAMPIYFPLG